MDRIHSGYAYLRYSSVETGQGNKQDDKLITVISIRHRMRILAQNPIAHIPATLTALSQNMLQQLITYLSIIPSQE